jgi:protease-4
MNEQDFPTGTPGPAHTGNAGGGSAMPPGVVPQYLYPPPRRGGVLRIVLGVFSILVLMGMVGLMCLVLGFFAGLTAVESDGAYTVEQIAWQRGSGAQKIAIIPVHGIIDNEQAEFIRNCVNTATADTNVAAVVLWVDSPGGFVGPSDQIWHQLQRLRDKAHLPIVASYGSLAASGGYYVSCMADEIYAEPTTVTGSIGVMASAMTFNKLLTEKLGITPEVLSAGGSPDKTTANDILRDWTDRDRAAMQELLDAMYRRFARIVAEARAHAMSAEQLAAATTGKVYMAAEAKELGLIDEVGYLDEAIEAARVRGGIAAARPPVVIYRQPMNLMQLFGFQAQQQKSQVTKLDGQAIRRLLSELAVPQAMYLYHQQ